LIQKKDCLTPLPILEKNMYTTASKNQRDPNWDATITNKSKSKNLNELLVQNHQTQSQNTQIQNNNNLRSSNSNLKDSKTNKSLKNVNESQDLKIESLKNSKVFSTSSNQSKKEEIASMNNTSRLFNNPNMNGTNGKGKGTINSKNDISAISYQ